jgi:hypothetical protein
MLTYEEARRIAEAHAGKLVLVEEATQERPFGWYFLAQSKAFVETGEHRHKLIGSGGFVVDRETGRVHEFGSAYPVERNLRAYAKGFRYSSYDLTILTVRDVRTTARLLKELRMTYVEPEEAYGVVWRIPKDYRESQLRHFLHQLPYTFSGYNFFFGVEVFEEIDEAGCCTYELREHQPPPKAPDPRG